MCVRDDKKGNRSRRSEFIEGQISICHLRYEGQDKGGLLKFQLHLRLLGFLFSFLPFGLLAFLSPFSSSSSSSATFFTLFHLSDIVVKQKRTQEDSKPGKLAPI